MARYKGSLTLDWYNKERAIILQEEPRARDGDVPAPRLNWVNKDQSLFYEIDESEGRGLRPYWVDRNDMRVREVRPLVFQKAYEAVEKTKDGTLLEKEFQVKEHRKDVLDSDNLLIRGDNLLALRALQKHFEGKPDEEKVKCIYIDPPYNTGSAFEQYDDNLAHSEWLTMMRDRLIALRSLLREDGGLFIQIDTEEHVYLSVLLDEVFGRNNSVQFISIKRASPAGFKAINPGPVSVTEYILFYAKDRNKFDFRPVYVPVEYDSNYGLIITNIESPAEKWKIESIDSFIYRENGVEDWKDARQKWGVAWKQIRHQLRAEFALRHKDSVVSVRDPHKPSALIQQTIKKSKEKPGHVIPIERADMDPIFIYNGGSLAFYKNKVKKVDSAEVPTELLTNFWDDIKYAGIAREGGIKFKNSKKPERLIKRVFEICTDPNDLILDCFAGSGTTLAVAQKMGRRYIGVEVGKHAETHIIPRMKKVLSGEDQGGISKAVEWRGGGSFRYCVVGPSILDYGKDGRAEFRWKLGREELERNLLLSYDFQELKALKKATIGYFGHMVGIASLAEPNSKDEMMTEIELQGYVEEYLEKEKQTRKSMVFYTNRGIEIAVSEKPENLEIIKVPQALIVGD